MRILMGCAAAAATMTFALAGEAVAREPALQPAIYLDLQFGAAAPALQWGARLDWDEGARRPAPVGADAFAAGLRETDLQVANRALPPLLQFSARGPALQLALLGAEVAGYTPLLRADDGGASGGFRWTTGKTWLVVGVAATAVALSLGDSGSEQAAEVDEGGSGSNQTRCGVGGNVVPPDPQIGTDCTP